MGWRSLRLALDRPGLLRTQIRALLQAADGRPLKILVPMVTEVFEFRQAKQVVTKEYERLRASGKRAPDKIEMGAMIEVPSLLFELDLLLPECDFVSIGSNDLIQFLTAADRANPRVAGNYDPIGLARLRAIRHIVAAADGAGVPVTMCGELAGRPLEALALMAVGMRRLSMGASSVGPVKEMILGLDLGPVTDAVLEALDGGVAEHGMRALLSKLAQAQGLPL